MAQFTAIKNKNKKFEWMSWRVYFSSVLSIFYKDLYKIPPTISGKIQSNFDAVILDQWHESHSWDIQRNFDFFSKSSRKNMIEWQVNKFTDKEYSIRRRAIFCTRQMFIFGKWICLLFFDTEYKRKNCIFFWKKQENKTVNYLG